MQSDRELLELAAKAAAAAAPPMAFCPACLADVTPEQAGVPKNLLLMALSALESAQGNINPERGFADEAEQEIAVAIDAIRAALTPSTPAPHP